MNVCVAMRTAHFQTAAIRAKRTPHEKRKTSVEEHLAGCNHGNPKALLRTTWLNPIAPVPPAPRHPTCLHLHFNDMMCNVHAFLLSTSFVSKTHDWREIY